MNWIYVLRDPRDNRIRYVGITVGSLKRRLAAHLKEAKSSVIHRRANWIRSLLADDLEPAIEGIEQTDDRQREIYWIAHYRALGYDLTNGTDGGDGVVNPTQDVRDRIAKTLTGSRHTDEAKTKISASLREQHANGQRIGSGMTGRRHSPETVEKMKVSQKSAPSYGMLGKRHSAETIEKIRQGNIRAKAARRLAAKGGEAK